MRKLAHSAALLCLCLGISAVAQTQFGAVTGRVSDTTGALISQAKVTLTNTATNVKQETRTNPGGLYAFARTTAPATASPIPALRPTDMPALAPRRGPKDMATHSFHTFSREARPLCLT